ncbi:MAG: TIGR02466 family protein [Pseudomonadota bacterium]
MAVTQKDNQQFSPELWFSTPIWSRRVLDADRINQGLMKVLERIKSETGGIVRSNVGGWHSHDQIHTREDVAEIRRIIGTSCAKCADNIGFDFGRANIVIKEMWFNENQAGDFNKAHIHPNAFLSGVYYVQTPEGSGNIELYDPVPARLMTSYPISERSRVNSQAVEYKAEAGTLLIFPSWLQHSVQPSQAEGARVSISFNVSYQAAPKKSA